MRNNIHVRLWTTITGLFSLVLMYAGYIQWITIANKPQLNEQLSEISWENQQVPLLLFENLYTATNTLLYADGTIVKQGKFTSSIGPRDQDTLFLITNDDQSVHLEQLVDAHLVDIPLPIDRALISFAEVSPDEEKLLVSVEQNSAEQYNGVKNISWYGYSLKNKSWSGDFYAQLPKKCLEKTSNGEFVYNRAAGWYSENEQFTVQVACFKNGSVGFQGDYPLFNISDEQKTIENDITLYNFSPKFKEFRESSEQIISSVSLTSPKDLNAISYSFGGNFTQEVGELESPLLYFYWLPYTFLFSATEAGNSNIGLVTSPIDTNDEFLRYKTTTFGKQEVYLHNEKTNEDTYLLQWFGKAPNNFYATFLGTTNKILITLDNEVGIFDIDTKQFAKLLDLPTAEQRTAEEIQQGDHELYQITIL